METHVENIAPVTGTTAAAEHPAVAATAGRTKMASSTMDFLHILQLVVAGGQGEKSRGMPNTTAGMLLGGVQPGNVPPGGPFSAGAVDQTPDPPTGMEQPVPENADHAAQKDGSNVRGELLLLLVAVLQELQAGGESIGFTGKSDFGTSSTIIHQDNLPVKGINPVPAGSKFTAGKVLAGPAAAQAPGPANTGNIAGIPGLAPQQLQQFLAGIINGKLSIKTQTQPLENVLRQVIADLAKSVIPTGLEVRKDAISNQGFNGNTGKSQMQSAANNQGPPGNANDTYRTQVGILDKLHDAAPKSSEQWFQRLASSNAADGNNNQTGARNVFNVPDATPVSKTAQTSLTVQSGTCLPGKTHKLEALINRQPLEIQAAPTSISSTAEGAKSGGEIVHATRPADSNSLAAQLADAVRGRIAKDGQGQMHVRLQLQPEHLGEVNIKIIYRDGNLSTHFHAASEQVKHVIESSLGQLRENLASFQLNLQSVSVSVGGEQGRREQSWERNPQFRQQHSPHIAGQGKSESLAAGTTASSAAAEYTSGLNYFV